MRFFVVFILLVAFASSAPLFSDSYTHLIAFDSGFNISPAPLQVTYQHDIPKSTSTVPLAPVQIADDVRVLNSAESAESKELYLDGQKLSTKEAKINYVLALLSGLRPHPIF